MSAHASYFEELVFLCVFYSARPRNFRQTHAATYGDHGEDAELGETAPVPRTWTWRRRRRGNRNTQEFDDLRRGFLFKGFPEILRTLQVFFQKDRPNKQNLSISGPFDV